MHPPSTPDEPSMYFSQTRAPRATPELPAPARQTSSHTVTATNDRPRAYPPYLHLRVDRNRVMWGARSWLPCLGAHKGDKAPIQAGQRWHVERTNAWHNAFNRLQRCYERRESVIDAYFDLADAAITVRSLIRQAWITHRWDGRPTRRP
jgi:hypothetical protein